MPTWVRDAYEDYVARLASTLKVTLTQIEPGSRSSSRTPESAMRAEGERLLAAVRKDDYVVTLDEHGTEMTTRELATWLATRMKDGRDLAFLIGGPDGLSAECWHAALPLVTLEADIASCPGTGGARGAALPRAERPDAIIRIIATDAPIPDLLCLASVRPRRRELLAQIGVSHTSWRADIDERCRRGEPPARVRSASGARKGARGPRRGRRCRCWRPIPPLCWMGRFAESRATGPTGSRCSAGSPVAPTRY